MLIGLHSLTAHAQPCGAAASIEGEDRATLQAVRQALQRRGVALTTSPTCARVRARIERQDQQLSVRVEDAFGRASERVVTEPESAATVIESWMREDLSAPLLATPRGGLPDVPQASDAETPPEHTPPAVAPPPLHEKPRGFSVSALADTAVSTDGSLWLGVDANACMRFGIFCAGLLGRVSFDTGTQGASERYATGRTALDLMLGIDVPWSIGALRISPGFAMGAGWIHNDEPPEDDEAESDSGGLRGNAHIAFALPITAEFAIELGLHGDLIVFTSTEELPGGETVAHPLLGFARASVGLRYELR